MEKILNGVNSLVECIFLKKDAFLMESSKKMIGRILGASNRVSQGYLSFGKVHLIRKEDKDKYLSIEDINKPSVRIGVNPGGTNESFVRKYLSKANITVVVNNLNIPLLDPAR